MYLVTSIIDYCTMLLQNNGIIGFLSGMIVVVLESIIPALPLSVFVALNVSAFGLVIGIIMSYIATIFGCYIAYLLSRFISTKYLYKRIGKKRTKKLVYAMKHLSFSKLVVVMSLPFTPAFLVNIVAGLVLMSKKKFIAALICAKIFMIMFWGFVGKSIIENLDNIKTVIVILILVLVAYILSRLVNKKFNIE